MVQKVKKNYANECWDCGLEWFSECKGKCCPDCGSDNVSSCGV